MIDLQDSNQRKKIEETITHAAFSTFTKQGELHKVDFELIIEDIVQDIYCKIIEIQEKGEYIQYPTALVNRLTINHCLNWMKKRKEILIKEDFIGNADEFSISEELSELRPDQETFQQIIEAVTSKDYAQKSLKNIPQADLNIYRLHKMGRFSPEKLGKKGGKSSFYDKINLTEIKILFETALFDKKSFDYNSAILKFILILDRLGKEKRLRKELKQIQSHTITELAHCKMNQGIILSPDGALALFQKAQSFWKKYNDPANELYVNQMIGVCYKMIEDFPTALDIFKSVVERIKGKRSLKTKKGDLYRDLGSTYSYLDDQANAMNFIERSVSLTENIGIENYRISQKYLGDIYMKQKKYDHAYQFIQDSFKDIPKYNVLHHLKGKISLSRLFYETGDVQQSVEIIKQARNIAQEYGFLHQYKYRIKPLEIKFQQLGTLN